jgi:hypothetical protein
MAAITRRAAYIAALAIIPLLLFSTPLAAALVAGTVVSSVEH